MGQQWLKSETEVDRPRKGITFSQKRQGSDADESEVEEEAIH